MNLRKSAASFSESDSERFHLDFLFEDTIYAVYFSLALHSSTHHGVQLVLVMNQGDNPFTLVKTGDTQPVYLRFHLDFLFEDTIYAVYFSLALRSSTHHGVQLVLVMNQGDNPFTLVKTGDTQPVYLS